MLKCASVYTYEIDNPEIALREITDQLAKKITLLEHSVGIIMCHTEFIATGVLKNICDNMPFDLAGITTASQAVNDEFGELMLTIFVMTSDDVLFRTGVTASIGGDIGGLTKDAYETAAAGETRPPKLAIVFPPFLLGPAGDAYVRAWGKVIPGIPVFGTLAIDDTASFKEGETIHNGSNYKTAMSFVLCYGNINPRFMIATLPENKAVSLTAAVTKADGPYVYEVNHMNAHTFFKNNNFGGDITLIPFLFDLLKRGDYDGVPVIRGHASFTEDGAAIFRGDVDEGSTFTSLTFNPDNVLATSSQKIKCVNELSDVNGVLLLSCIVRRMVLLGIDPLSELRIAADTINPEIPFMMGYAGGEICPTSVKNGVPTNRFHNYSLVILIV